MGSSELITTVYHHYQGALSQSPLISISMTISWHLVTPEPGICSSGNLLDSRGKKNGLAGFSLYEPGEWDRRIKSKGRQIAWLSDSSQLQTAFAKAKSWHAMNTMALLRCPTNCWSKCGIDFCSRDSVTKSFSVLAVCNQISRRVQGHKNVTQLTRQEPELARYHVLLHPEMCCFSFGSVGNTSKNCVSYLPMGSSSRVRWLSLENSNRKNDLKVSRLG